MSQDVVKWLAEIQQLRQQLTEAQRERDAAYASADNWRKLYETEAQQRRTEGNLNRQTIETLRQELQQWQQRPTTGAAEIDPASAQQEVNALQTTAELQAKLLEVWVERDRLVYALQQEQANHAQTRKSLTTALGDTIDMLAKERGQNRGTDPDSKP